MEKAAAFLTRSFLVDASYQTAFMSRLLQPVFPIVSFYYISRVMVDGGSSAQPHLGGYFAFVFLGITLTQYFSDPMRSFGESVHRAQNTGVLEVVLSTRTRPTTVIVLDSVYSFLVATARALVSIFVGVCLLGADLSRMNLWASLAVVVASLGALMALGVLCAAAMVVTKRSNPIELLVGTAASLLAGTYFPIEVLPGWAQLLGSAIPMTYALEAMRLAVLDGRTVEELGGRLLVLAGMSVVLIPISVCCLGAAIEKGRRDGNLFHH